MKIDNWKRYNYSRLTMKKLVLPAFKNLESEGVKEFETLNYCGRFIYTADCCSCHTLHFTGYNKCRSRWCINCNHVRALAWIARLIPVLESYIESGIYITKMNLTIPDQDELRPAIEKMQKSWNILTNGNGARALWKIRFPGGMRSLEVKIGKNSGKWHPHYHSLMIQGGFGKDYDWVKDRWKGITERQFGKAGSVWMKGHDKKTDLLKAVVETVKYIMAPEKNFFTNEKHLLEAYLTLKGRRQINTWGDLRNDIREEDIEAEAMADDAQKKLTDFICQRCGCNEAQLHTLLYDDARAYELYDYSTTNNF